MNNDDPFSYQVAAISSNDVEMKEEPTFADIDEEYKDDPNQSPVYAQDIFTYLKEKEVCFVFVN